MRRFFMWIARALGLLSNTVQDGPTGYVLSCWGEVQRAKDAGAWRIEGDEIKGDDGSLVMTRGAFMEFAEPYGLLDVVGTGTKVYAHKKHGRLRLAVRDDGSERHVRVRVYEKQEGESSESVPEPGAMGGYTCDACGQWTPRSLGRAKVMREMLALNDMPYLGFRAMQVNVVRLVCPSCVRKRRRAIGGLQGRCVLGDPA